MIRTYRWRRIETTRTEGDFGEKCREGRGRWRSTGRYTHRPNRSADRPSPNSPDLWVFRDHDHETPLLLLTGLLMACGDFVRVGPVTIPTNDPGMPQATMSFHDLKATDINGNEVDLSTFAGKKVLVVNTASECGYTPQYAAASGAL